MNRQLNLRNTKATAASTLVQDAATRVSHDTLILSETHLLSSTGARPLHVNYSLHWASFLRQPGRGHGPRTLALRASQPFVYR